MGVVPAQRRAPRTEPTLAGLGRRSMATGRGDVRDSLSWGPEAVVSQPLAQKRPEVPAPRTVTVAGDLHLELKQNNRAKYILLIFSFLFHCEISHRCREVHNS